MLLCYAFVGKCHLRMILTSFNLCYFYYYPLFTPYVTDQGIAETQHMIIYFLTRICHKNRNFFESRHLSSGLQCHQHYSGQINMMMYECNLNQKNKPSSSPTFLSWQSNDEYQTFCSYKVKVFQYTFVRYTCVVVLDF